MAMVVKLGGSSFMGEHGPKLEEIRAVVNALGREHAYVIGGGRMARGFYNSVKELGDGAEECLVRLMHANVCALSKMFSLRPVYSEDDACFSSIASSFRPGMSSDGVAAIIAKLLGADMLVILTNVPGILDSGGRVIRRVTFEEFADMGKDKDKGPCNYWVVDGTARKIVSEYRIPAVIGRWEGSLERLMEHGTVVGDA